MEHVTDDYCPTDKTFFGEHTVCGLNCVSFFFRGVNSAAVLSKSSSLIIDRLILHFEEEVCCLMFRSSPLEHFNFQGKGVKMSLLGGGG
jgi:hypothetical protein